MCAVRREVECKESHAHSGSWKPAAYEARGVLERLRGGGHPAQRLLVRAPVGSRRARMVPCTWEWCRRSSARGMDVDIFRDHAAQVGALCSSWSSDHEVRLQIFLVHRQSAERGQQIRTVPICSGDSTRRYCRRQVPEQPPVGLSRGPPSHVSLRRLQEEFPFLRFLLTLIALGNLVHYFLIPSHLAVTRHVTVCCMWNTEIRILREILRLFGAMFGSTVDTCTASVLGAFGRITHIFYNEVD